MEQDSDKNMKSEFSNIQDNQSIYPTFIAVISRIMTIYVCIETSEMDMKR